MTEMPTELKTALVQARIHWADPEANRAHLSALMDRAPDCDLYVLPETCTTGFLGDAGCSAEGMDGPSVDWLRDQAAIRAAAVTGSFVIAEAGRTRNRMLFAVPEGTLHVYDKAHLFGYGGEERRYSPGRKRTRLEWRGWRIDLQVCYDLRFPVWCRNDDAFDLQLYVANWPAPRVDAWATLLKARAIENQAFVIGVNRVGTDGNEVEYPGRSSAWDPAGERLVELDDSESVETVELDLQALRKIREKFRFLADRDSYLIRP